VSHSISICFFPDATGVLRQLEEGNNLPKLLLLDMQMPNMDGIDTLRALDPEKMIRKTAIVMCSALEEPAFVREAYSLGARLYLRKPTVMSDFADLAKLCLEHADEIRNLPVNSFAFGVLDVRRALAVMAARQAVAAGSPPPEL
jgi:CheY-like chemotaxis protein